ncbi:MAG: sulfotransferase family protein [Chloroflexota bacterium]
MTAIKPNLFIIGAAKSGTTSLHHALSSHPAIFMSTPKEPGFFVPEMDYYPKSEDWYLSLFEDAGQAEIIGESSTHYTKLPTFQGVPERIAAYCESPRFLYLMRDPIDRIVSQYWHGIRQFEEKRPLAKAVREDPEFVAFSDYKMQLEPYFDVFGRDRVLVLTFEELTGSPDDTLRRVLTWLGVDPDAMPPRIERRNARPREFQRVRGLGLLHRFAKSTVWDRLSPFAPRALKDLGNRLALKRVRPEDHEDDVVQEVVEFLRPSQQEAVYELSRFLGRDFPDWTTTFPD